MKLNCILGLPRVGSTLMCNLLAQNPRFRVSDTSILPGVLDAVSSICSKSPEVKGMLAKDRERTESMIRRVMRSICTEWYDNEDRMVFDKSRGWIQHIPLVQALYPDAKFIVMIHDVRAIVASIEKQDRNTAIFKAGPMATLEGRLKMLLNPLEGMIGAPMASIKDILNRKLEVHFVKTSDFTANPRLITQEIYEYLEVPYFKKHDYDEVINVSNEPDFLYLNKFPHVGEGKIQYRQPYWDKYLSENLCKRLIAEYAWYYQVFYPDALTLLEEESATPEALEVEDVDPTG